MLVDFRPYLHSKRDDSETKRGLYEWREEGTEI